MVTVGLLSRLLGGTAGVCVGGGIVAASSALGSNGVCITLLTRIASPRVAQRLGSVLNPRCLSFLVSSSRSIGHRQSSATSNPSAAGVTALTAHAVILSPLLVTKYLSYARINTKSTATACPSAASKTDTKSSSTATVSSSNELFGDAANMGLFAKFKHMYKQYWYVLIPVHVITSVGWLGGFYYLAKSGVDVPALLQHLHLSETIIDKVRGSEMGHYAIAYLCYKVATPIRYAVTLGGTTVSIKYLVQWGHIKPMPSKSQLIKMYEDTKDKHNNSKSRKDENHK